MPKKNSKNDGKITAADIYKDLIRGIDTRDRPHETFRDIWAAYQSHHQNPKNIPGVKQNNNMNGEVFEFAICETFVRHGVRNLYYQCKLWSMPHDRMDIIGWAKKFPVLISCKTSLRERWKQAELEGRLVKGIFPRARSYIVIVDSTNVEALRSKIDVGDVTGLDNVFVADQPEFDELCESLVRLDLAEPEEVIPIKGKSVDTGIEL